MFSRLLVIVFAGFLFHSSPALAISDSDQIPNDLCENSIPKEISKMLSQQFPEWIVQEPGNLSKYAFAIWLNQASVACPGVAKGLLSSGKDLAYMVLLISADPDADQSYMLLALNKNRNAYTAKVIDHYGSEGKNVFIAAAPTAKYFDVKARKIRHATNKHSVLFITASESEYQTELYFYAGSEYRHEPIDN